MVDRQVCAVRFFYVRRRRAPSSHVSNETYSGPNGTEDPRRLVSTAVAWRVSQKCLKRLAGSVSPGFGSEFSFSSHTHAHTSGGFTSIGKLDRRRHMYGVIGAVKL